MTAVAPVGAERAAARAPRSRRRRVLLVVVALLLVVIAGFAVLRFSGLFAVDRVEVVGAGAVGADRVEAAAGVAIGTPLVTVDGEAIARRVEALPPVADAQVTRRWPATLRITVTERRAAAVLPVGDEVRLFDAAGVEFATAAQAPKGLPVLSLDRDGATEAVISDAIRVHAALPPVVRDRVTAIKPTGPNDLRFALASGAEVRWGSATDTAAKIESLQLLLSAAPGRDRYDVSAPGAPAASEN